MVNPYATNETAMQIYSEETWLQGAIVSQIAYGVELTLFVICFDLLLRQMNRTNYRVQMCFLAFICTIFVLGTLFTGSIMKFTQLAFIENRNYPGGPAGYENDMFWIPVDELGNGAFVIGNWVMDALLVWRFTVIYRSLSGWFFWPVIAFPCLLLMASFVLGVLFLIQTSASSPFGAVDFTLAYFVMSLALNIIVTIMIVARLLFFRHRLVKALGKGHVTHLANIVTILVESASLYSAFSIMFLVPFALNNALSQIFLQSMGQVQTISSLLIIYRVASGKGWTDGTAIRQATAARQNDIRLRKTSSMRFASVISTAPGNTSRIGLSITQEVLTE